MEYIIVTGTTKTGQGASGRWLLVSTEGYDYEQYQRLYQHLGGKTTHFVPVVGTQAWPQPLLSREEFKKKLARLQEMEEIGSDEWMGKHEDDYIDAAEAEAWESLELRSILFIIEWERAMALYNRKDT